MKKKTIIAIAALLACGQGAWADGTVSFPLHYDEVNNPEDGTADHPYQIQSVSDLNTLASDVNSGTDYNGKYFELTADLDYRLDQNSDGTPDYTFTPIGFTVLNSAGTDIDWDNSRPFKGIFHGKHKNISGITLSGETDLGIFGFIHGATIQDLTLDDSNITGSTCIGGIVGEAYSGEFVIDNCHVTEDVTIDGGDSGYLVGGIIGYARTGTIKDCSSAASVTGDEAVGGIAGSFGDNAPQSRKSCIDCYYSANSVTGSESCGPIIGENNGVDFTITLLDDDSNATIKNATRLSNYNGMEANVTLSGRTLYKDNSWNTLCLPFNMTDEQVTAQLAPTKLMTLSEATFTESTLTLNFENATSIEAGKPYIIKWESGSNFTPTFTGVTISSADPTDVEKTAANFHGIYTPYSTGGENKSMLYLGASNTLYYPNANMTINAFRAYFTLNNGIEAGTPNNQTTNPVRAFVLNFGDEQTGIVSLSADSKDLKDCAAWYTPGGVRLDGKPSRAGVYINNGKKVVIK